MATFTITTPVNIDSLASKTGGDVYNVNGGVLTIDQDSRYGLNQTTSSSLGAMTLSATLGGTVEVDARFVRLIPFDTGSGNVPASNTIIEQGGASGKLIGVWSALNAAPTAVGAAMPASGYIKIKQWNSTPYAAGALTGIAANATGADVVGWIELVGDEAATCTVNRLNSYRMRGEWYEVGTTSGVNTTTYQLPTSGSLFYLGGVYVETGTGTDVYEFYPCAGTLTSLAANFSTLAAKGKVCWISTAGLLRFRHDGTNSTGGYLPPAGARIRIPNIITQNCTTAARTANVLPNATLATRYDYTTTGGGVVSFDKVNLNWYPSFTQAFSVALSNVTVATQLSISEIASPMTWSNVNVGQEAANSQTAFSMTLCFAGGTFTDCTFARSALGASGNFVTVLTDINGFTFTRLKSKSLTPTRGNANTGSLSMTRAVDTDFVDCTLASGQSSIATCTNVKFTNTGYFDNIATTTPTTNPASMFSISSNCLNVTFDGVHFHDLVGSQPYTGILSVGAAGCTNINLRNIGTYAAPLDMGSPRKPDVTWTRSATTATVTSVGHGLKVGDVVYVDICSSIAAIVIGAKTVASVPTADTFTFTALNAGATSGTLSYYGQMCGTLVALAAGAAANTVRVQRCYVPRLRSTLYSSDNSSKNVTLESVFGDYTQGPTNAHLNGIQKNIGASLSVAAQTAVYGTHWFDDFLSPITPNQASVSWSRSTTTATVTSANHGLRTGQSVVVTVSSATAAIVLGTKSITALTENTFSFTCLNAGATSGTLTFVPLTSRIGIFCNEATADTVDQYTIDAGNTAFTSTGGLFMPTIGGQITFEQPYYLLGHTGFPIAEAVMGGGTIDNYHITYAIDKNDTNGYGPFHNLYYGRAGGAGSNGASTVTVTDATGVEVGDYVFGTNVGPLAKVTDIVGNTLTLDTPNIGAVSGVLRFAHLPSETGIDASVGFKMKIRIKTVTTNTTAITSLLTYTTSTDTSRAYQYPLDPPKEFTFNVFSQTGSPVTNFEFRIYEKDPTPGIIGTIELAGQEVRTSNSFTYEYQYVADKDVVLQIIKEGYEEAIVEYVLGEVNQSFNVILQTEFN